LKRANGSQQREGAVGLCAQPQISECHSLSCCCVHLIRQ
jgi:hypothetical protein